MTFLVLHQMQVKVAIQFSYPGMNLIPIDDSRNQKSLPEKGSRSVDFDSLY